MKEIYRKKTESPQAFLERLAKENKEFYSNERGYGAIRDLQQKFRHTWIYIAELIQNAVDEKATEIRFTIKDSKTLIFEHNGEAFDYAEQKVACSWWAQN